MFLACQVLNAGRSSPHRRRSLTRVENLVNEPMIYRPPHCPVLHSTHAWPGGETHYIIYQWLSGRASDSRLREPGFKSCAAVLKPSKFFNSTLLQFIQLYKRVPDYRQWWICVRAALAH